MPKIEELSIDIYLHIAPFLNGPSGLFEFAITSKHFWSAVNEAAHQLMVKVSTAEERACLPRRDGDSWIGIYHEFLNLRKPLRFDQLIGSDLQHSDCFRFVQSPTCVHEVQNGCVISNHVMRAGKHYVSFDRVGNCDLFNGLLSVGVIRPTRLDNRGLSGFVPWDDEYKWYPELAKERTEKWGNGNVDYCVYCSNVGACYFGHYSNPDPNEEDETILEWEGMERCIWTDNNMGLLLDLDNGTLSVFRNNKRLGVMKEGLTGEYCWMVMLRCCGIGIKRAAIPDV